jgi:hypothetical protein
LPMLRITHPLFAIFNAFAISFGMRCRQNTKWTKRIQFWIWYKEEKMTRKKISKLYQSSVTHVCFG